jgi:hypothetical protein
LYRCAWLECRSLVDPLGYCLACIQPELSVEKGARLAAEKGECLTIPFVLRNGSTVSHTLRIDNVFRYGRNVSNEVVPIGWEKLEGGRERNFSVETEPFTGGGLINLGLILVIASRVEDIEELYAFAGEMHIDVEHGRVEPTTVQQIFNMENAGTGVLVKADQNLGDFGQRKRQAAAQNDRRLVPLQRVERYERENGYRGYQASGGRIPRNVEFVFQGFPAMDAPPDGPLRGLQPILRCGRNSRNFDAQLNPHPNDLCLRIYDPKSDALDKTASSAISRNVCEFMLQNDRLYLRAITDRGLTQNGEILKSGDIVVVNHGDTFATPVQTSKTLTFSTKFKLSRDEVRQIRFEVGRDLIRRNN